MNIKPALYWSYLWSLYKMKQNKIIMNININITWIFCSWMFVDISFSYNKALCKLIEDYNFLSPYLSLSLSLSLSLLTVNCCCQLSLSLFSVPVPVNSLSPVPVSWPCLCPCQLSLSTVPVPVPVNCKLSMSTVPATVPVNYLCVCPCLYPCSCLCLFPCQLSLSTQLSLFLSAFPVPLNCPY